MKFYQQTFVQGVFGLLLHHLHLLCERVEMLKTNSLVRLSLEMIWISILWQKIKC